MFERFTDDARQAVVLAQEEAVALHHGWIGTEHVLLGVLRSDSDGARLLAGFGVDRPVRATTCCAPWAAARTTSTLTPSRRWASISTPCASAWSGPSGPAR